MRRANKRLAVESQHGGARQQTLQRRRIKRGFPCQNPGVAAARFADQRPAVVRVEFKNPVVAIKGAKKLTRSFALLLPATSLAMPLISPEYATLRYPPIPTRPC
jgi:hypothetical protein